MSTVTAESKPGRELQLIVYMGGITETPVTDSFTFPAVKSGEDANPQIETFVITNV